METPAVEQEDAVQRAVRRRVLRGLIGVPAVATLAPGAALAQSNLQCRTDINPQAAVPTDATPQCVVQGTAGLEPANRVGDPDLDAFTDFGPGSALRQFTDHDGDAGTDPQACVAYIDTSGAIEFDAADDGVSAGHAAVTATCFVSFAP